MDSNRKYGRTQAAPVRLLPPLVFDFSGGKPPPPGLGKTHVPVRMLPELTGGMTPTPVVRLTLWLRPEATAGAVGADLFALWKSLDELDRNQNGAGLRPADVRNEQTADGEVIQIVLAFAGTSVIERGDRLRDAINSAVESNGHWAGRSFVKWSAESIAA